MTVAYPPTRPQDGAVHADDARSAFWWRVLAVIVDVLVLSLINGVVDAVFGVTHVTSGSPLPAANGSVNIFTSSTDVGPFWPWALWLVYYLGLEALFGASIGKWAARLRVTDHDGRLPSLRQIAACNLLRPVDVLPSGYLVGGIVALRSPARQRLGDQVTRTLVVPRYTLAAPLLTRAQLRRRLVLAAVVVLACLTFCAGFFYYGRPPLVVESMANTRQTIFSDGVSTYALSAPAWGAGTVTYQVTSVTQQPVKTCHARLTFAFSLPRGWAPQSSESSCEPSAP